MATRGGTTRVLGRWRSAAFAAIVLVAGGSSRLTAQSPPLPPPADTAGSVPPRAAADTSQSASALAAGDSVNAYRRMSLGEYGSRVLGPRALLRDVATAGFDQATGRPTQWPKSWRGYGDRVSSRLGTAAVAQAVVFGVSNALGERPAHFTLCGCTGTRARITHALLMPMRMDTPRGPHLSLLAPVSELGSSILITSLHPGGFSVRDGLIGGAVGVLGSALGSVGREFWPWHRRPFGI
jgi:hypothetical protein